MEDMKKLIICLEDNSNIVSNLGLAVHKEAFQFANCAQRSMVQIQVESFGYLFNNSYTAQPFNFLMPTYLLYSGLDGVEKSGIKIKRVFA